MQRQAAAAIGARCHGLLANTLPTNEAKRDRTEERGSIGSEKRYESHTLHDTHRYDSLVTRFTPVTHGNPRTYVD